ncbi:MAG: hypothetical protein GY776_14550 [Alteromonas sp.]|nr:hypothetical protein [Alteromonas sp.]
MQLNFPKILTRILNIRDYHPAYDTEIHVWCNAPREFFGEYGNHAKKYNEGKQGGLLSWASKLWSQGDKETHVSVDEIKKLIAEYKETDPNLFNWMVWKSLDLAETHKIAIKKV